MKPKVKPDEKAGESRAKPRGKPAQNLAKLRAEKVEVEKQLLELRFKRESDELWPIAEIRQEWSMKIVKIKEVINSLELPMETRAKILSQLAEALK